MTKLIVFDNTARRRDHNALQQIRAALLAHVGEMGRRIASPSDDIGDDLVTCAKHVVVMNGLIDEAAAILDRSN